MGWGVVRGDFPVLFSAYHQTMPLRGSTFWDTQHPALPRAGRARAAYSTGATRHLPTAQRKAASAPVQHWMDGRAACGTSRMWGRGTGSSLLVCWWV